MHKPDGRSESMPLGARTAVTELPGEPGANRSRPSSCRWETFSEAEATSMAREAANSRVWAGIHYPADLEAGMTLGRAVARKFIEWADNDGSK